MPRTAFGTWGKVGSQKGKKIEIDFDDGSQIEYSDKFLLGGRTRQVPDFMKHHEGGWTEKQLEGQIKRGGRRGPGDRPTSATLMADRKRRLKGIKGVVLTEDEKFEKEEDAMLRKKYGLTADAVYRTKGNDFEFNGLSPRDYHSPWSMMNRILTYSKGLRPDELQRFIAKDSEGRSIADVAAANGASPIEVKAYDTAIKVAEKDFNKLAKEYDATMDWYGYGPNHENRTRNAEAVAWMKEHQKAKRAAA